MEEELAKIWSLVGELSEQLAANRALVTQLKSRSDNVKGQAAHVGAGFPLRRFNVDISDEEFATELEAFASHLVTENQQLQHENKQLNALLKEYEQTLETVMGKFRGVAHASQQHELQLHSYYTSLLHQLQTAHSSAQLHDDTTLSLLLSRLSVMLRSALRISEGEDVDVNAAMAALPAIPGVALGLLGAPSSMGSGSGSGPSTSSNPSNSPPSSPARSATASSALLPHAHSRTSTGSGPSTSTLGRRRAPHFPGSLPGSSGGYKGTDGQADWALERETEIERLQAENASLRDMLQIAKDSVLPSVVEEAVEAENENESPTPDPAAQSRKGSLTAEELSEEADTEQRMRRMMAGYKMKEGAGAVWMVDDDEEDDEDDEDGDGSAVQTAEGPDMSRPPRVQQRRKSGIADRLQAAVNGRPSGAAVTSTGAAQKEGAREEGSKTFGASTFEADTAKPQRRRLSQMMRTRSADGGDVGVKVPSGNTGLAEHEASKDSAHHRSDETGETSQVGKEEKKGDGGDGQERDEEMLEHVEDANASAGPSAARPDVASDAAAPASTPSEASATDVASTPSASDQADPTTVPDVLNDTASSESPAEADDPERPITATNMEHSPALAISSAGEGPAEIDLADAGVPIISTDGEVQHLPVIPEPAGPVPEDKGEGVPAGEEGASLADPDNGGQVVEQDKPSE